MTDEATSSVGGFVPPPSSVGGFVPPPSSAGGFVPPLSSVGGFVPPPYPYDRLDEIKAIAARHANGGVDLSIGTPTDAPPDDVIAALSSSNSERGYPPSIGTVEFRDAAAAWLNRRVGTDLGPGDVRATIGSKEFVAGLPHWLRLRSPDRDTVLYPQISYPSYAMGATLAGCRAVPIPINEHSQTELSAIDPADVSRALCLWVSSPGNPTGALDDLSAAAEWGRTNGVPVVSDECYIEFTWNGPPRSILESGNDGVIAVHSLSKRSNLAGVRSGFYAGDQDLINYISEVRKHAGFIPPGPVQAAAIAAFSDQVHVDAQRNRYFRRLQTMQALLRDRMGVDVALPDGSFYLWVPAPGGDAWGFAETLAEELGIVTSPGEFYGDAATDHVRIALVRDTP
ncbi:MAG: aminotransferase class I/II-fold pyridoxal phosphate-dependent enzyme [Acidimicrobiales bacterium]|nr:aminotransferase class I/II-fold pyridoxal phosphate-dependent enzyme [Acidimicrobiales bacterium]